LGKTEISLCAGLLIGLADSVGFFYTVRMFVVNTTSQKRVVAGFLEAARMILLCALVVFLNSQKSFSIIWLLAAALLLSLGGKFFFIFKRLKK